MRSIHLLGITQAKRGARAGSAGRNPDAVSTGRRMAGGVFERMATSGGIAAFAVGNGSADFLQKEIVKSNNL